MDPQQIVMGLTVYVVLLFSLSVHESAHAWTAWKLGDDTAYSQGRVSLNPLVHIDPIGTVLLPLIQVFTGVPTFGWAKPTPYDPANFRRDVTVRQGHMLVAAAGPVSNIILAVLFAVALVATVRLDLVSTFREDPSYPAFMTLLLAVILNVILAVFNLLPIPPLDGSKVASYGLPGNFGDAYDRLVGPYGFMILVLLMISGVFRYILDPIQDAVVRLLYGLLR